MALLEEQKETIRKILVDTIRNKFENYKPETSSMPFHTKLLGKDRLALYSFIHSLNTAFGTSIFKPVSIAISSYKFLEAHKQYTIGSKISSEAQMEIQRIIDELNVGKKKPDKESEIERIRAVANKGNIVDIKPVRADIYLLDKEGEYHLIDIKSAKPNMGEFKGFKRTLLEWAATILLEDNKAKVHTLIGIPYNPYEPLPYERWTLAGMLDLNEEVKVARELWDFLGGENTYEDLLACFEDAGIEMREEIDEYFDTFLDTVK